jgi:hypothetical protein
VFARSFHCKQTSNIRAAMSSALRMHDDRTTTIHWNEPPKPNKNGSIVSCC